MTTRPDRLTEAAGMLYEEGLRFQKLAEELILRSYHQRGPSTLDTSRLIRDHEIRAETFRAASQLIHAPTP